jgi:hypothetical protein
MLGRAAVWAAALGSAAVVTLSAPVASQAAGHRTYSSPGYTWNGTLPKVAPTLPGKVVTVGDGALPSVLVDAAGTAQVAYSTEPELQLSVLHDCVLQRGQTGCSANQGLVPPASTPEFSTDNDGPLPLAVGNELLMLDYRYPDQETLPDGNVGSPTFLWTSEDGGASFTGPGEIGRTDISGNAIVYGGANPQIAWVSDTTTGGTFFDSTAAGAYQPGVLTLGDQGPDEGYNGRLALDGDRPVAEFSDLENHVYIREYNGTGDIMQSSSWSVARIEGQGYSRIVGGPSGVFVLYQKTFSGGLYVQKIVNGQPSGAPSLVTPDTDFQHAYYAITEDAGGQLTVGYFVSDGQKTALAVQSSSDGRRWSAPQLIARGLNEPTQMSIAAAPDGGGYAAFQVPSKTPSRSTIQVAAFGTQVANGQKGLGNLDGTGAGGLGGDPNGSTSCTDVHFGDIDAIAQAGCFLRDPSNPTSGAAISEGEIRLNGLQIIPDAGVKVVIDPRQHTINTTGEVSVKLRAPGIGDITLYHGELHMDLGGDLDLAGNQLFDLSSSGITSTLEGFPIDGNIDVQIKHDAVEIPISIKLPPYMGGITGSAVLEANNADGLDLNSLEIKADDVVLGALEIKNLDVSYQRTGSVWKGSAHLNIPAGSPFFGIDASVEFDDGDFNMGSFQVNGLYPGIPIFTDTYLTGFGGGFDIHPGKRHFFGSIDVGAIPLDPPNYTLGITGVVGLTFNDNGPVVLTVDGTGSIHGLQVATAGLTFSTNGFFEMKGQADLDLDVVDVNASVDAFAYLPQKEFSSEMTGDVNVAGIDISGIDGIVSTRGTGACGSYLGLKAGFGYVWGGSVSVFWHGCDFGPYRIQPPPSGNALSAAGGRVAADVAVVKGTPVTNFEVRGTGGAPSVVLTDPAGHTVTPVALSPQTVHSAAISIADPAHDLTYVSVTAPRAGNWQVTAAPGSAPIAQVLAARGYPAPTLHAKVTGTGATRTLTYTAKTPPGTTVQFAERGSDAYKVLGTAKGSRGTLRFTPADGSAGRRAVVALLTENGLPARELTVAHYVAPAPPRPGKVHGLRVSRRGRSFGVAFGKAGGASHYLVSIDATDGHRYVRVIAGKTAHRVSVPALGYGDAITATVRAVSSMQRTGPAVSGQATYTSKVLRRAQREARHAATHHRHHHKKKKRKKG